MVQTGLLNPVFWENSVRQIKRWVAYTGLGPEQRAMVQSPFPAPFWSV